MKIIASIALALAAAGNIAANFALDGAAQVLASVVTGLVVIASAVGLILMRRARS